MKLRMIAVTTVLLFAACAPITTPAPGSGIQLTAEPAAGVVVDLILANGSSDRVGYNLCTSVLQRDIGGQWTNVPTDEVCTMELRTLNTKEKATFRKRLPAALAPGSYRYVTAVEVPVDGGRREIASNVFRAG